MGLEFSSLHQGLHPLWASSAQCRVRVRARSGLGLHHISHLELGVGLLGHVDLVQLFEKVLRVRVRVRVGFYFDT